MNIFLIISDTFRYDNLHGRAAMPVRTPKINEFAKRAVSLSRMYTGSFPTIPHRTDVTSGRYVWPWYSWQDRRQSTANHAPNILGKAGYISQLICDCPHLFNSGFQFGFHGAMTIRGQEADVPMLRMNYPIEHVQPPAKNRGDQWLQGARLSDIAHWTNRYWRGEDDRFPPRTASKVVEWLEENYKYDPLFLWADFFDPHEPWDPPEYMVRKYDPDASAGPMFHPNYGRSSDLTAKELKNLRAHYCAEAELVDRWVGRVLEKIDDLDLWKNSIVIFTSDHGMSLGEHQRTGKTNINKGDNRHWPIYPEIAHVPFLIAAPGLKGGTVIDELVQPVDILPTLLDLAGLDLQPPEPFHGRSFASMLRGRKGKPIRDAAIAGSFARLKDGNVPEKLTTPAVYTKRWFYAPVGATGKEELCDLRTDPLAQKNVARQNANVCRQLRGKLIEWMEQVEAPAAAMEIWK